MIPTGYGDLAANYRGTLQTSRLRAELERLSQELASGQRADLKTGTGIDMAKFSSIQTSITTVEAYTAAAKDAAVFAEAAQASLEVVQDTSNSIAAKMVSYAEISIEPGISVIAQDAKAKMQTVVSAMNARFADRALFSGTAVRNTPLADANTMLADVQAAVTASGATTAVDVEAAVVAWFDTAGGGFETDGYLGETTDLAPFKLSATDQVDLDMRADDQAIRDVLKGFMMASLIAEGQFSADLTERAELLNLAGATLINANESLGDIRAVLGETEEKIQREVTRNEAEIASLELARSNVLASDPYEAATALQATEVQLQTLYAVTARLSNLSLVNFL